MRSPARLFLILTTVLGMAAATASADPRGRHNKNLYRAGNGTWYDMKSRSVPGWVRLEERSYSFNGYRKVPVRHSPIFTRDPAVSDADFRNQGGRYTYGYTYERTSGRSGGMAARPSNKKQTKPARAFTTKPPPQKSAEDRQLEQRAKQIMQQAWTHVRANAANHWDKHKGRFLAGCKANLWWALRDDAYRLTTKTVVKGLQAGWSDQKLLDHTVRLLFDWSPQVYVR